VALLLEKDGQELPPLELPLVPVEDGYALAAAGQTALELAAQQLRGAQRIRFRLRARDILPTDLNGPHETFSDTYTVVVDPLAPYYSEQLLSSLQDNSKLSRHPLPRWNRGWPPSRTRT